MSFELPVFSPPDFDLPGLKNAPDAVLSTVTRDGVAPDGFHATSIYPEYFRIDGQWKLATQSRMDATPVWENGEVRIREFRLLRTGDRVICGRTEDGSEGIYVHQNGFRRESSVPETFAFRSRRSRETAFSRDYDQLYDLLRYERSHGHILWVLGPAFTFDHDARDAFSALVEGGYCHGLLAGNALATHDLEAAWLGTALGQDIYTQRNHPNGHYNHLDTINRVRRHGGIEAFIRQEDVKDGIMRSVVRCGIAYVLCGSIRDDGPLPEVIPDVYEAQDRMREHARQATTVICMATMLHTIAVGNMTPSYNVLADGTVRPVYFYCVDISEFAVNKLSDRGSLSSRGIVTNVQDFIVNLARGLGLV